MSEHENAHASDREPVEVVAADAVETVELEDDGTVVDVVEADVVEAVRDATGDVVELVETHVVDTEVVSPDGSFVEVVETEVIDARVEGDDVVVTDVVDVDLVESRLVEGDDATAGSEVLEDPVDTRVLDDAADTRVEQLDDGSAAVAGAEAIVGSPEALPFEMPPRERFAALDDVEVTGDARVDAATARLDEVPDLPTGDHVAVYEDVHRRLQDALSDTEVR
ncbi:MAG TPA: hypothetical protein VFL59_16670 [Candidatus Nanopelagicales bacterium]|nr:hypothetical protein [Candidatus Nanopelagicales bacterium]